MLMDTYKEMRSKWGFNEGILAPLNADTAREAIVKLINEKLPEDCDVEAYEYDRPGMHNWCLILYRKKGATLQGKFGAYYGEEPEPEEVHGILYEAEEKGILEIGSKYTVKRRKYGRRKNEMP